MQLPILGRRLPWDVQLHRTGVRGLGSGTGWVARGRQPHPQTTLQTAGYIPVESCRSAGPAYSSVLRTVVSSCPKTDPSSLHPEETGLEVFKETFNKDLTPWPVSLSIYPRTLLTLMSSSLLRE